MTEQAVEDLPDFPALQRLAAALWNEGQARGAAVLVGAGFSRNAERAGRDTAIPPLWSDLRKGMAEQLYPGRVSDAPQDALRLAEEFRTYLGQEALVEFLRERIPDASWLPGEMHRKLMALPWADVLTTNYDTLLERASSSHKAVVASADLARVRGQRVVKLHGSIDASIRLVIAEDDYRTYPTRSAAFVNTARQVFLENELCLIGFSGDDPNFLQWSGWVRDHLGDNARRIYLVGSLDLSPAKRRLLESRNVTPIDFARLTSGLPKSEAEHRTCELFLDYLSRCEPRPTIDWQAAGHQAYGFIPSDPTTCQSELADGGKRTALLKRLSDVWQADLASCPDWIVVPRRGRQGLAFGTNKAPWGFENALGATEPERRVTLLVQLVRRRSMALEPLLGKEIAAVKASVEAGEVTENVRTEFLLILLHEARMRRDEDEFRRIEALLVGEVSPGSDAYARLVAQGLLWARDGLDLEVVRTGLAKLSGPDPYWDLVKVSLHCECGELARAGELLARVCADLADRSARDPRSVWASSRLAWAEVLTKALRTTNQWTSDVGQYRRSAAAEYDPYDELNAARTDAHVSRLRKMAEPSGYQPRFAPGTYTDHSRAVTFRGAEPGSEAAAIFRLADASGLPLRVDHTDLFASAAEDALENEPLPTTAWHLRLLRTIRSGSASFNRHFDGVSIARLDADLAVEITTRVLAEARFWSSRVRSGQSLDWLYVTERLRVCLEVLSRLVIRADPERALEAFRFAHEACKEVEQLSPLLHEPLGELLKWSLLALPLPQRPSLVLDCLDVPLPTPDLKGSFRWPDPASDLFANRVAPIRPPQASDWSSSVARLLAAAGVPGPGRAMAVHRLAYLATYGALEEREMEQLARAVWSMPDSGREGLPRDVDLYPHVVASLPAPTGIDPAQVVSTYLFDGLGSSPGNRLLLGAVHVAAIEAGPIPPLLPSPQQAAVLLDALAGLEAAQSPGSHPLAALEWDQTKRMVRRVLGSAILPRLEPTDMTAPRQAYIEGCIRLGEGGGALEGSHEMVRLVPGNTAVVVASLRRALARGDMHDALGACRSVVRWVDALKEGRLSPPPTELVDALIGALEMGAFVSLQPRLWCARKLLEAGMLSPSHVDRLAELLPSTWNDLSYDRMPQEGPEAVGITLARAACVRIAASMAAAGRALQGVVIDAAGDPLPEVRFADSDPDA